MSEPHYRWWMHAGDAVVRLVWRLLWSWRAGSGREEEAPAERGKT
jgi:hypothetical protein